MGPLAGGDAALKYSPNPPGRLILPSGDVVYSLVILLTEPCLPTGVWQIIYYGFGIDNVSGLRVVIGSETPPNWVRFTNFLPTFYQRFTSFLSVTI